MAPKKAGTQSNSTPKARTTAIIRANPDQTAILKKAFQFSNVPTSEQLQALSGETNLPPRWIHQWFGRQRVKYRKQTKVTPGTDVSVRASSSHETLHVKQEVVETSIPSPTIFSGGSENLSVSGSICSVAGNQAQSDSSASQNRTKNATVMKPTARVLRSERKADATTGNSSEAESISVRNSCKENDSLIQQSGLVSAQSHAVKVLSSPSKCYNHQPPGVSPPRRSSRVSEIQGSVLRSDCDHTSLSTNQDGGYMPVALDSRLQDDKVFTSPSFVPRRRSKSQKFALYNQGPVFRTRFYNNFGPSDYSYHQDNSAPGIPNGQYVERGSSTSMGNATFNDFYYQGSSNPTFSVAYEDRTQSAMYRHHHPENRYVTRPLAPAFDWENHVPSDLSNYSSAKRDYSVPPQEVYGQHPHYNNEGYYYEQGNPHRQVNIDVRVQGQYEDVAGPGSMNANVFAHDASLDPYVAPLRHLTDVLGAYRDEHGTYTRLMDEQEHPALTRHLLDESLLERNPFQAAMGLSLMSKIGLEWEY